MNAIKKIREWAYPVGVLAAWLTAATYTIWILLQLPGWEQKRPVPPVRAISQPAGEPTT